MINKNILLIDYGNSCLKAWVVNATNKKIVYKLVSKTNTSFTVFKNKITKFNITASLWACTNGKKDVKNFIQAFKKEFKRAKNIFINQQMLMNKVNIPPQARKQVIGVDILLLLYFYANQAKSCLVLSLGTVYFALVIIKKKLVNVLFMPNATYGLNQVSKLTSIANSDLPTIYEKTIGLKTKDCFAAGCYHSLNGFINSIKQQYPADLKVYITGGDAIKYPTITKKYYYDNESMLKALLFFYYNH